MANRVKKKRKKVNNDFNYSIGVVVRVYTTATISYNDCLLASTLLIFTRSW